GRAAEPKLVQCGDGGLLGALITTLLSPLDVAGSYVTLAAVGLSSLLLLTEMSLAAAARHVRERSQRAASVAVVEPWRALRERRAAAAPLFLEVGEAAPNEEPNGTGRRRAAKAGRELTGASALLEAPAPPDETPAREAAREEAPEAGAPAGGA